MTGGLKTFRVNYWHRGVELFQHMDIVCFDRTEADTKFWDRVRCSTVDEIDSIEELIDVLPVWTPIPHSFDLMFDINSLEKLRVQYWQTRTEADAMEAMAKEYGLDLGSNPHPPE